MQSPGRSLVYAAVIAISLVLVTCSSPVSDSGGENEQVAPAEPEALEVSSTSPTTVQLLWNDAADNEDGFVVEWSTLSDFSQLEMQSLPANSDSATIGGLTAATDYYLRVRTYNSIGSSDWVETSTRTDDPPLTPPMAPSALSASPVSDVQISVTWIDESDNEDGFTLQRSTNSTFSAGVVTTNLNSNQSASTVGGLAAQSLYYFRIRAENGAGNSQWSGAATATTYQAVGGSFSINGGGAYTTSTAVTLNSSMTGVVEMRFSNTANVWSPQWQSYSATKSWTLASGDGTKTVYAQYRTPGGAVTQRSDSIVLDTVGPVVTSFVIDGDNKYTLDHDVALSMSVAGATQMSFSNDSTSWSSWQSYGPSRSWTIPPIDEDDHTVYSRFRDAAGNVSTASDTISVDTVPPTVTSFTINGGSDETASLTVTLNMEVSGATHVRFRPHLFYPWSAWYSYSPTMQQQLRGLENQPNEIQAQFKDGAGNLAAAVDDIYFDAIRRIRISATKLWVTNDGDDDYGNGEIYWAIGGYNEAAPPQDPAPFSIHSRSRSNAVSLGTGAIYTMPANEKLLNLERQSGRWYEISFTVWDADDQGADDNGFGDETATVFRKFYYDDWGISATAQNVYAQGSNMGAVLYFTVQKID